jgi:hypothetical protein
MRQTLVAFLFCLIHSVANAQAFQYMHPSLCDRLETVLDSLITKYGEKLQWSGKDLQDESGYMMFENPKGKTWTLIKFNKEYACILGVGGESKAEFGQSV